MANENIENQRNQIKRNPTRYNTNIKRGQEEKSFDKQSSPSESSSTGEANQKPKSGEKKEEGTRDSKSP